MHDLPEDTFADPVLIALRTKQQPFAICRGELAVRYPEAVTPFAAVTAATNEAWEELRSLMRVGEYVWITAHGLPTAPGLAKEESAEAAQMVLHDAIVLPPASTEMVQLFADHAAEMVALTNIAFPGFFRAETYRMGRYYGIREGGQLIAMTGERLALRRTAEKRDYIEVSGVCTHPAHRGKGLAASLIGKVVEQHRHEGVVSFLHVSANNANAIALYERIGFRHVRRIVLNKIVRTA